MCAASCPTHHVGRIMSATSCLQIGLQSIYEDVARDTNRGHTVAAVKGCFRLAKDAGFKVRLPVVRRGVVSV